MAGKEKRIAALAAVAAVASFGIVASSAGAALLHDQYAPPGNPGGFISAAATGPATESELADDFTVPAGLSWTLDSVDVLSNSTPPSINITIYAAAGAVPGAVVASRPAMAYTGIAPDRVVSVVPAVTLQPGTYWIAVQGTDNGFGWIETPTVRGAVAAFRAGYVPACTTFGTKGTCGIGELAIDQAFRLNGTAAVIPPVASVAPVATPAKKCKKGFRLKTITKKGKKRKKCVRKKRKRR